MRNSVLMANTELDVCLFFFTQPNPTSRAIYTLYRPTYIMCRTADFYQRMFIIVPFP